MVYDGNVKWLPVSAAAKTLGVSVQRVYVLVSKGQLASLQVDKTILVSANSIRARLIDQATRKGVLWARKEGRK